MRARHGALRRTACAVALLALSACATPAPPDPALTAAPPPPPPPPVLEAGSWRLASMAGSPAPGDLSISFADGVTRGQAFCNRFFGDYKTDGRMLRIIAVGSTRTACPALDAEERFFGLFTDTDQYEIGPDGRLTLIDLNGGRGLVFDRP